MNQRSDMAAAPEVPTGSSEFSLINLLIVLAKHKRLIIGMPAVVAILSLGISLILPNVYLATSKLLPPQQAQSGAAALLSQLGGAAGAAAGMAGIKSPNDLYVGMLKSRTIADSMIARFDLKKAWDQPSQEKTRLTLAENTVVTSGKDGLITIAVEDLDQKLVARLANGYVDELMKMTRVLAVTEASQRRLFFERQLEQSKDNLAKAEMALKSALDTHGVISVDSDSRAIVETVGRLRAQISAKEIQLSSMEPFMTSSNPQYRRAQEELNSARAELARLENGRPESAEAAAQGPGKQVGLENIKILREVKYHQMLYELLAKQYEVARLDEAKDSSVIQVLDPAIEPERKSKPKRAIIVVMSTLVALMAAIFWAFATEARQRVLRDPAGAARWNQLKSLIRGR